MVLCVTVAFIIGGNNILFSILFLHIIDDQYIVSIYRRTGSLRPTSGPNGGKRRGNGFDRHKRKPPRGMYINHDDIVTLAGPENGDEVNQNRNHLLASMDREISSLLGQVR